MEDLPDLPVKSNGECNLAALGMAASTAQVRKDGLRAYNEYAKLYGKPLFQDLKKCDVANDGMEHLMWHFLALLCSVPIPVKFVEGFAAPTANSKAMVKIVTIAKWFMAVKCSMREKFPEHETWP